ncbi:MAG: DUF374 domain-containing protein [Candidatus Eisenbacteria bacterium]|nr:DUF374 domain-containing protein [Candidatus Eisenbacteria bacterium]
MARRRTWLGNVRRRITRSDAFVGLLASAASLMIRAYAATIRMEREVDPETEALDPAKVLYAFWHGRQFLLVPSFRHRGIAVMTDLSWAGRIQAGIMTRLGYPVVRGSSRRQAGRALAEMKHVLESGCSAAFAVDGPSGPIHKSKPGIIYLAQKLGYPIVPVATSARPAWSMGRTWCRYLVPAPFSRGFVALGGPIDKARTGDLTSEQLDEILTRWTARADERLGVNHVECRRSGHA